MDSGIADTGQVDGKAHNLFGDGFALWIAKDRAKVGPVFGSVGESHPLGRWRPSDVYRLF